MKPGDAYVIVEPTSLYMFGVDVIRFEDINCDMMGPDLVLYEDDVMMFLTYCLCTCQEDWCHSLGIFLTKHGLIAEHCDKDGNVIYERFRNATRKL